MEKVNSFEDIKRCKRLFYFDTLYKIFKEVKDVDYFIYGEEFNQKANIKSNCLSIDYINHHNFHVIY